MSVNLSLTLLSQSPARVLLPGVTLTSRRGRSSVQKQQEVLLFPETADRHKPLLFSRCSPARMWVGLLYKDLISRGRGGALAGGNSCSAFAQDCSAPCSFCTRPAAAILNWVLQQSTVCRLRCRQPFCGMDSDLKYQLGGLWAWPGLMSQWN